MQCISDNNSSHNIDDNDWKNSHNIELPDPEFLKSQIVDI